MGTEYIYKVCSICLGDGLFVDFVEGTPRETEECPRCKGLGKVLWGFLQDELENEE